MRSRLRFLIVLLGLSALAGATAASAAEPLPELELDPGGTTVSGLSSGAFMAVQLHVAFSDSIIGVGVVAGGPYFCAEGQLATALNRCMQTSLGAPNAGALLARAQGLAEAGAIDPLAGLADDRVYLFSGTRDSTVTEPVMNAAREFYRQAGVPEASIKYVDDLPAGHAFIVEDAANACGVTGSPFINDCDHDQAGEILQHLYGALAPPAGADEGRLFEFDQAEFLANPAGHGMASNGFVYIPAACATGEPRCRLHIAFAGCKQTPADIGDLYPRATGYNAWAESNRLVILYPQSSASSGNPNGCWDWWGYDDPVYHTRRGRQMAAVAKMAARLGAPLGDEPSTFCQVHDDWNWNHWLENRARMCGWVTLCAVGSGDPVGFFYSATTLYESPEGSFSTTPCSP